MRLEADNSQSTWRQWLALTVLGIASLWINSPSYSPNAEIRPAGFETFALAESIVEHHTFADPFWASPTGFSAHLAPLYPAYGNDHLSFWTRTDRGRLLVVEHDGDARGAADAAAIAC